MAKIKKNRCIICGGKIRIMSFKGTGVCRELCRKGRDGEFGKLVQTDKR